MQTHEVKTLPEAQAARQVLKAEIKAKKWKTPAERAHEDLIVANVASEKRVLKLAIEEYQASRNLLDKREARP